MNERERCMINDACKLKFHQDELSREEYVALVKRVHRDALLVWAHSAYSVIVNFFKAPWNLAVALYRCAFCVYMMCRKVR